MYLFLDCIFCILFHIIPDIHVTLKASQMAQKMWLLPSAICKGLLYAKVAATFSFNEILNWNGIGVAQKLLLLPPGICKGLLLVKVVTTSIQLWIMSTSWLPYSTDFIFVFVSWVGGGNPPRAVPKCLRPHCGWEKQAGDDFFAKYPCHAYKYESHAKKLHQKKLKTC